MIRYAFLLILLSLAAAAAGDEPKLSELFSNTEAVDIVNEKDQLLQWSFIANPGDKGNGVVATEVLLTKGESSIVISDGTRNGNAHQFVFPASNYRLTAGEWKVVGVAIDSVGRTNQTAPGILTVSGTGAPEFSVRIENKTAPYDFIHANLGTSIDVVINATDRPDLLHSAKWQTNDTWRAMSRFGEILQSKNFDATEGELKVQFTDRLGRTYNASVGYEIDAVAPLLQLELPNKLYSVVENELLVTSNEDGFLSYIFNGTQTGLELDKEVPAKMILEVDQPGVYSLVLSTYDQSGNVASDTLQFAFIRPTTEVSLRSVGVDEHFVLLGDIITLESVWNQTDAAAPALVTGNVSIEGEELHRKEFTLDRTGEFQWVRPLLLPPGQHVLSVQTSIASDFNQSANQITERNVTVEVFLGKVVIGNDTYFIRQGEQGFPIEAVGGGNTYPLTLRENATHPVYDFEGLDAFWDSDHRTTAIVIEVPEEETKDTPAPFALVPIVAAFVLRRR